MRNELAFNVPFSGFTTTDFINCFTSTPMVLEGISGDDEYDCKKRKGQPCDGCGNCRGSTSGLQEQRFFVFDTMWHTFNCHNFAEVFRYRTIEELKPPMFDDSCARR